MPNPLMSSFLKSLFFFALLAFAAGCANVKPPEGGMKDTIPPRVDSAASTPNFQTNFQKQTIRLTFDEWVKLQDVFKEVVISPPLAKQPEITLKGKTVRVVFDENEQLKDNATYTINFGNAIKDLTEGNPAKDLRFVFSTGDFIDSLSVSGVITDAFTNKPAPGALFLLYDNMEDSVVRTQRPFYFGRADEQGAFRIENVRADTFKAFALLDANLNYLYDQSAEMIGFPPDNIVVAKGQLPFVKIRLSKEKQKFKILEDAADRYGFAKVKFSGAAKDVRWTTDAADAKIYTETVQDSILFWYDLSERRSWNLFFERDTNWRDTVKIKPFSKEEFLKTATLEPASKGLKNRGLRAAQTKKEEQPVLQKMTQVSQNPDKSLTLTWNFPLASADTSKILLFEDSTRVRVNAEVVIDSLQKSRFIVRFPWKEEKIYELLLLPGALSDWYGQSNDSIAQPVLVAPRKAFGSINLTVKNLSADTAYILEILTQGGELAERFYLKQNEDFKIQLKALTVGAYTLRLTQDLNGNGEWDPADYDKKIQPEKVFLQQIEQLRANWEVEFMLSAKVFEEKQAGAVEKRDGEKE